MPPVPSVRGLAIAVLLGIVAGAFSSLGDGVPVMVINGLANAASPWILAAFLAGILQRRIEWGAVAGALALLTAVAVYYGGFLLSGYGFLLAFVLAWSPVASGCGALFGAAGSFWAVRRDGWRAAGVVLLCGALLAEAAYRLVLLEVWTGIEWDRTYMQVAIVDTLAAFLVLLGLVERRRWPAAFAGLLPVAVVGVLVFMAGGFLVSWASGIGPS